VYSYGRGWIHDETAEELHADDGVDEEEHAHQHAHVGQGLQQHQRYNSAKMGGAARLRRRIVGESTPAIHPPPPPCMLL
jgi:hypothetical protein